ncbi:MAG: phage minor head protein [Gemmobacter sp.]
MKNFFFGLFGKPLAQQISALRIRLGNLVPTGKWDDLWQSQHDRAVTVAGALKADLLADLAGEVKKAIEGGQGIESFRKGFREVVERRGWHGWTGEGTVAGEAWRTRVIYKTNMATSYAAGRHAQLVEGGFPFWVYRHGGSRDPREQHLEWDGLVLPADHPFWATHAPPNGWGCSCFITGARSDRGARRRGGDPDKELPPGWNAIDPRTGAPPGIDKGWAYSPGASVADDIRAQVAAKAEGLPDPLAAALRAEQGG